MKERPILFNGPMVRAILDGTKTQTRRIAKPHFVDFKGQEFFVTDRCPHGMRGDRLWVRETWFDTSPFDSYPLFQKRASPIAYRADDEFIGCHKWKPSFLMPRRASRITLEVTAVRVERLQDMEGQAPYPGESDALAEGVNRIDHGRGDYYFSAFRNEPHPRNWNDPTDAFRELWEQINGPGSWGANPWVWVVEFHRIEGN